MKALILAAGLGTRLAPITNDKPKSLVPVNGTPIIIKQIDNLLKNGIADITVISGYKSEILEKEVHKPYPDIHIVESVNYATTNNMYSAYLGRNAMAGNDFLMMNADVFYDATVIEALLQCKSENAVVVDIGTYMEESMKVVEKDGRLVKISKEITKDEALGASIDVYKFSVGGGAAFFKKCAEYIEDKNKLKLWSEVALNDIFKEVVFHACPLKGKWLEIDNHDDLAAAERLFSE